MHPQFLTLEKFKRFKAQLKCIGVFLMLMTPFLFITFFLSVNLWLLGINLFASGWLLWTFVEYIVHRFWMHDTPVETAKPVADYHMRHHRQPREMDITTVHRFLV